VVTETGEGFSRPFPSVFIPMHVPRACANACMRATGAAPPGRPIDQTLYTRPIRGYDLIDDLQFVAVRPAVCSSNQKHQCIICTFRRIYRPIIINIGLCMHGRANFFQYKKMNNTINATATCSSFASGGLVRYRAQERTAEHREAGSLRRGSSSLQERSIIHDLVYSRFFLFLKKKMKCLYFKCWMKETSGAHENYWRATGGQWPKLINSTIRIVWNPTIRIRKRFGL